MVTFSQFVPLDMLFLPSLATVVFPWTAMIIACPARTFEVALNKSMELGTGGGGDGAVTLVQFKNVIVPLVPLVPLPVTFTVTLRHGFTSRSGGVVLFVALQKDKSSSKRYRSKLPAAKDSTATEVIVGHE